MDKTLRKFDKSLFTRKLTAWYEANKRELPWRKTKNPYRIWVSEIMLQQTKVDTVIDYYERFMSVYPTVFHLAEADEQAVLKMWEGLGYYSRARNLHAAAKEVVARFHGEMPDDPKLLGELKGIGPYTQGAIASIAFGKPEPAVDGNVMRVLSRVLLIKDNISEPRTRKHFESLIRELIIHTDPSAFNQGLMELGALVCTPKNPACLLCPVKETCRASETGEVMELPVKLKKKKQRIESYIVLLLTDETGKVAIEKRPETGLLANMWQFPMVDKTVFNQGMVEDAIRNKYNLHIHIGKKQGKIKHVFSHIIWELDIYEAKVMEQLSTTSVLNFVGHNELKNYPISVSHMKAKAFL